MVPATTPEAAQENVVAPVIGGTKETRADVRDRGIR